MALEPIDDTADMQLNEVAEVGGGGTKQASQGDIMGLTDTAGGFSPLAEMWSMPSDITKWGPRARFESMEDINAILEMVSEDLVLAGGYCDYTNLHFLQQTMRLGLAGQAREEMLSAMHAATNRESQKWGFLGKLLGKDGGGGGGPADRGNPVKD